MGPTLNTAAAMNAYALADRGTWLNFKNRGDLVISLEGDKKLFNQYGVMLVNPIKHPHVKADLGRKFVDWLVSPDGQKTIADYSCFSPTPGPDRSALGAIFRPAEADAPTASRAARIKFYISGNMD